MEEGERRQSSNVGNFYFTHQSDEEEAEDRQETQESEERGTQSDEENGNILTVDRVRTGSRTVRTLHYSTEDIHQLATQAELLVLTSSLHPSEEDDREKGLEGYEDEEEKEELAVSSQPDLPRASVVTNRAAMLVWRRSLPRNFEFSLPTEVTEHKPVDCTDGDEGMVEEEEENIKDIEEENIEEEVEEVEEEREEEGTQSGQLGSWDHDLQEQYISEGASFESPRDVSMRGVLAFGEDYSPFLRRRSDLPSLLDMTEITEGQILPASPTLVVKRVERELLLALQEAQEIQEQGFGERDQYERLVQCCTKNLSVLDNMEGEQEGEHSVTGLRVAWDGLQEELGRRLSQSTAYYSIAQEIDTISNDLRLLGLDQREEEVEVLEGQLEELERNIKPCLVATTAAANLLHSEVSAQQPDCLAKVSLTCYCCQELSQLATSWEERHEELSRRLCRARGRRQARGRLEYELVRLEQDWGTGRLPSHILLTETLTAPKDQTGTVTGSMGDRLNWVEGELARLQEEGGLDDAYAVQVTAYLAIIKKGKSRHLVQAQHHWRSLLLVSSVALISVYSVAWHCMNSLARALASTLTLMGYNQTQESSSVFLGQ